MEYTINMLCKIAGVSSRTLRYYDQIDLLKPKHINESGYRVYGVSEIDRLQQILFYREFDIKLSKIKEILDSHEYDRIKELQKHIRLLKNKRYRIDLILNNIHKTLLNASGNIQMETREKFQGIKSTYMKKHINYVNEAYTLYPRNLVDSAVEKEKSLSLVEYNDIDILNKELIQLLEYAISNNIEYTSEMCFQIYKLHKKWLKLTLPFYTCSVHLEIAILYISDLRFTEYYDKSLSGCAQLLHDIIKYVLD